MEKYIPRSKKARALIVSAAVYIGLWALNMTLLKENPIPNEAMMALLGLIGTYIIGQGIADHGAQGQATEVRRAMQDGTEIGEQVTKVLSGIADVKALDQPGRFDEPEGPKELLEGDDDA